MIPNARKNPLLAELDDNDMANPAPTFDECERDLPSGVKVEDELRDNGSIRMLEADSYDVMVDGLKRAAIAARHVFVHLQGERFIKLADMLDALRKNAVLRAGRGNLMDTLPTVMPERRDAMTRMAAYLQIKEGLDFASHGARQMGSGHRGEEFWVTFGWALKDLEGKAMQLIRARAEGNGLVVL